MYNLKPIDSSNYQQKHCEAKLWNHRLPLRGVCITDVFVSRFTDQFLPIFNRSINYSTNFSQNQQPAKVYYKQAGIISSTKNKVKQISSSQQHKMTKYWTTNSCALSKNKIFDDWDAQGYRKGLYTELFFLFLIYFISQLMQSLFYKNTTQARSRNSEGKATELREPMNGQQKREGEQQQAEKSELPWHEKKWNRTFAMVFSHNCVAVGMCVLFSPFAGAVTIAYLHLFFFIIYCIMELKFMALSAKIARILMDMCNLTLILIGTASINLNTCKSDNTCKGVQAGTLNSTTCFN